jgi:glycogen synthase
MTDFKRNPRVLIVTPEVAYLPHGMDNVADYLTAKASELADVSAALINALFEQGADVYVSIPDYRWMFNGWLPPPLRRDLRMSKIRVPKERLHIDKRLAVQYGPQNHAEGKKKNKRMVQKSLGLIQDDRAPLFFWPSPLTTVHQGCQLLADILFIFEVHNSQGCFGPSDRP